jgi:ATP-dependent RNA helicase RhlE
LINSNLITPSLISSDTSSTSSQPNAAPSVRFDDLGLCEPLLRAVREIGYQQPTPIQVKAIPPLLAGSDLLACAQTGTGKTGAFALPILQRLLEKPASIGARPGIRALVLSPTRELAAQIAREFERFGRHTRLRCAVVFGGVSLNAQARTVRAGVDVLVATPGRLEDLLSQRIVSLASVEVFVLDEADRMLDDGFLPAVRRIAAKLPRPRQSMLFSATMPDALRPLANTMLHQPAQVSVSPVASTPNRIQQGVYLLDHADKRAVLHRLLSDPAVTRAVVFTRTKRGADRVAQHLIAGSVSAQAIHGNKSQNARERALDCFRNGRVRVLVATDLAARGIDIDGISHVINFDLPVDPEAYVHRIGRTGRAGASGHALSLCSAEEQGTLRKIERLIRQRVPVMTPQRPQATAYREPTRGFVSHRREAPRPRA